MLSCVLYRDHRAWWSHFLFTIWACGAEGAYLICKFDFVEFKHSFIYVSIRRSWVRIPPGPWLHVLCNKFFIWPTGLKGKDTTLSRLECSVRVRRGSCIVGKISISNPAK